MNCRRSGVCWHAWNMKNHYLLIEDVEGHCERGKADRYSVRSHKMLALPLRGLAWLLSRGSHLPLSQWPSTPKMIVISSLADNWHLSVVIRRPPGPGIWGSEAGTNTERRKGRRVWGCNPQYWKSATPGDRKRSVPRQKKSLTKVKLFLKSGYCDSNTGPSGPKPDALANCATPRNPISFPNWDCKYTSLSLKFKILSKFLYLWH